MTKKQKILEIAESIKLPPGWKIKLNLKTTKHNTKYPINTTRIYLEETHDKLLNIIMYAEMTRSGCIYKDTLQDSIEALEILKQLYEKEDQKN